MEQVLFVQEQEAPFPVRSLDEHRQLFNVSIGLFQSKHLNFRFRVLFWLQAEAVLALEDDPTGVTEPFQVAIIELAWPVATWEHQILLLSLLDVLFDQTERLLLLESLSGEVVTFQDG